jgi:hypothetical protein
MQLLKRLEAAARADKPLERTLKQLAGLSKVKV